MPEMLGEINRMTDANIQIVLNRFLELFEAKISEIKGWKVTQQQQLTVHDSLKAFELARKEVLRELCLTGCPYGKIWDCKHDVKS